MIRFLLPIFLLLAAFPLAAQGCYENLQNGAGVSADPSRASGAACKLRESLPEANRASFTTYSASLYRFAGNFAPGAAEALVTRLEARAAAASPYYLLIVWEASEDNLFATPHVRVNLPADGPFACLNPLRRSAWQARLLLQAQGDAPRAKDPEEYLRAETRLMEELMGYVKDLIKCCQEGQTCPDCITRKERIALLKAYPFRTIGETSYNPTALKYRVDNVEIPGNSTAQIRDGIGIPLDLGGGPIDIAETLKQLALEKPELGLNALIVHDSLLCDPELLPGRFFGGAGLRSAGSQVYVILQRDGKVDVLGDEQGKEEIFKALTKGKRFLKVVKSQKRINPCFYEHYGNTGLHITPTGKVIGFKGEVDDIPGYGESIVETIIQPGYSVGHPNIKDGCLIDFVLNGETYISLLEGDDYFWGYIKEDYFLKIYGQKTGVSAVGQLKEDPNKLINVVGVKDLIDQANKHKEPDQYLKESFFYNPNSTDRILTHIVDNGVVVSYEVIPPLNKPYLGTFFTENLERTQIACKTCDKGPGIEFYQEYYKKESTSPADAQQLCIIAQLINQIAKVYFESDLVQDEKTGEKSSNLKWNNAELQRVYGTLFNYLRNNGFSWADIASELDKASKWQNKEYREKVNKGLTREDLLRLSIASKSDRVIAEIPADWRYQLVSDIASGKMDGGSGIHFHGKNFNTGTTEGTIVRLFKHIKDADAETFFTLISNDSKLVKTLFKGFNDYEWLTGDQNYKAFFEAFLALYKRVKKFDLQKLATQLETNKRIYHLGDVVYRGANLVTLVGDLGQTHSAYFDLYCGSTVESAVVDDKLTISAKILSHTFKWNENESEGQCVPNPFLVGGLNMFDPIGVIISTREGDNIEYSEVQVMPAFALLYYSDVAKRNEENAEADLVVAGAALVIGVLTLPESSGIVLAIAVADIIGSVGEIIFSLEDLNNSAAWQTPGDASTFRTNWRIATGLVALASLPSLVKNAPDMVRNLVTGLAKLRDNTAAAIAAVPTAARNLISRLRAFFKTGEGALELSGLTAKFVQFGQDIPTAKILASEIEKEIGFHGSAGIKKESEISDDFVKLYAELKGDAKEGSRQLLITTFFGDNAKFTAFKADLKNSSAFFGLAKEGNAKIIKAWESLYKALPDNLQNYRKDIDHLLFFQNSDVQNALAWVKDNKNNLFTDYPSLKPSEIVGLSYYTRRGDQINNWIRKVELNPDYDWDELHANRYLTILDQAFNKLPQFNGSLKFLRLESRLASEISTFSKGSVLRFENFISMAKGQGSLYISGTKNWGGGAGQNFIMEIVNGSNVKIIDLEPFSQLDSELEALVVHGKGLEILDLEYKTFPVPTEWELALKGIDKEAAEEVILEELIDWATSAANPNAIHRNQCIPGTTIFENATKILVLKTKLVE